MHISETAYAKVNLYLHLTGRREDGYHYLDSLVAFTGIGDQLHLVRDGDEDQLSITGPFADKLTQGDDNLVLRVLPILRDLVGIDDHFSVTLEKNLPVSAGIGGGSADAAAIIRAFFKLYKVPLQELGEELDVFRARILELGADIPVCINSTLSRMRGIGETLDPVSLSFGEMGCLLVNNGAACPTGQVFSAYEGRFRYDLDDRVFERVAELGEVSEFLGAQTNDLEIGALGLFPDLLNLRKEMEALPDVQLVRMSGSGATFFALFPDQQSTEWAAKILAADHPDYWIMPTRFR